MLRRLGVDVHRHPHAATRSGHLRRLLEGTGVDVVLDVGANRGQFARSLRTDLHFDGRIISFEPDPATFGALATEAADDPRWECHPFALGARAGTATLHRFSSDDWNSLKQPNHRNLAAAGRSLSQLEVAEVEVRSLDAIWSSLGLTASTPFIKVDTQGSDLEVMGGAIEHLGEVAGVLVEAAVHRFYEEEPDLGDVLAWFDVHGWRPTGFFPVVRDRDTMALQTVDVTFVPA